MSSFVRSKHVQVEKSLKYGKKRIFFLKICKIANISSV